MENAVCLVDVVAAGRGHLDHEWLDSPALLLGTVTNSLVLQLPSHGPSSGLVDIWNHPEGLLHLRARACLCVCVPFF